MAVEIYYPSEILKPFVKHYWVLHSPELLEKEVLFPSGHMEFAVNISDGEVVFHHANCTSIMPRLEILGHLTQPTIETVSANTTILITKFRPHAAAVFVSDCAKEFTNNSVDLADVLNKNMSGLYEQIMEAPTLKQKIEVLEAFLIQRLEHSNKNMATVKLVDQLCKSIQINSQPFNLKKLAAQYRISERYIQKIFLEHVGISPRGLFSVQRFAKSLHLVRTNATSLTDIGYECGYHDQAHFIREFKSFTGVTPMQVIKHCKKSW